MPIYLIKNFKILQLRNLWSHSVQISALNPFKICSFQRCMVRSDPTCRFREPAVGTWVHQIIQWWITSDRFIRSSREWARWKGETEPVSTVYNMWHFNFWLFEFFRNGLNGLIVKAWVSTQEPGFSLCVEVVGYSINGSGREILVRYEKQLGTTLHQTGLVRTVLLPVFFTALLNFTFSNTFIAI